MTAPRLVGALLALALSTAPVAAAAKKPTTTKKAVATTKKPAPAPARQHLVNVCSLMALVRLDDLIADTREPISFSVQGNGGAIGEGEWKSQNLREIARDASSACVTSNVSGPPETQLELGITQQHKGIDRLLSSRPNFKRGTVDGIAQPTWIDRHGAELTDAGQLRKTAGCAIVVVTARGVFGAYWTPWRSLETDPGKISCSVAEELMRRELAALDAGGYTYLPAV